MDVVKIMQAIVDGMVARPGAQALIMDNFTIGIVSTAFPQSAMTQKGVYVFERVDIGNREPQPELKGVYFLESTQANVALVAAELREPHYAEYHLYFTSPTTVDLIDALAQADEHELVKTFQEVNAAYFPLNSDALSLQLDSCVAFSREEHTALVQRTAVLMTNVLLSLHCRPAIRCQRSSKLGQSICKDLLKRMGEAGSPFASLKDNNTTLLVLDRRDDPISPLLMVWTYQAMIHELLGIKKNRVSMKDVPGAPEELKEVVLSADQDAFYAEHMYHDFGELGVAVQDLVRRYQTNRNTHKNITTLADMKAFIKEYPEFSRLSGTVTKHVALMSELSRLVEKHALLEVSELQQDMSVNQDHARHLKRIMEIITNRKTDLSQCVRLVMLYALRYETHSENGTHKFMDLIRQAGCSVEDLAAISNVVRYCGEANRLPGLFPTKSFFESAKSSWTRGIQGVANVFTQHRPLLASLLDQYVKGKLSEADFPFLTPAKPGTGNLVVFIVGGATFSEAAVIHELNSVPGPRVILASPLFLNTAGFISELARLRKVEDSHGRAT